jgi:hypothetical protein
LVKTGGSRDHMSTDMKEALLAKRIKDWSNCETITIIRWEPGSGGIFSAQKQSTGENTSKPCVNRPGSRDINHGKLWLGVFLHSLTTYQHKLFGPRTVVFGGLDQQLQYAGAAKYCKWLINF